MSQPRPRLFARITRRERGWLAEQLRQETVGGGLLLVAALIALLWANSPWGDAYAAVIDWRIGPAAMNLNLSVATWAAEALLAVFFFVAGLELKHELVLGTLSRPAQAVVPIAAALGGMAIPALIYTVINLTAADGATVGWGIPMATDIAFALAVLAILGRHLPIALRAFLLTLAVVDDLGAISVIAIFYSDDFIPMWFAISVACFALYWFAQRQRWTTPWLYVPLALFAWYAMHESGVHATVAGVVLGLLTRVRTDPGERRSPADRLGRRIHPWSAAVCVPIFAFASAGVDLRAIGLSDALLTPVAIGVIAGLVLGKPIGVLATTWLIARFTRATLPSGIDWRDVTAVGVLAGIGFTVSLLISELAFTADPARLDSAKTAVLAASLISAALAAIVLRARRR